MKKVGILVFLAILALFALSVTKGGQNTQNETAPSDKVSLRLGWLAQAEFAGAYVAKEKDYFKDENLDVAINPGGVNFNQLQLVASGSDTFGIVNGDQLTVVRSKGVPLVAIAATFQQDPSVFFALKSSGISRPTDFVGKSVGVKVGTSLETLYKAMMKKAGLNTSTIKEVPVQFDMAQFFSGHVHVWPGFVTNEPLIAREKGFEINIIYPADFGINNYADTLFTDEKVIKNQPELVRRFLRAYLKGWRYAVDHPEEAVTIVLKYGSGLNKEHELAMMQAVIPLVTKDVEGKLGWMEDQKWENTYRYLEENSQLEKAFDIKTAYTTRFLREIYQEGK